MKLLQIYNRPLGTGGEEFVVRKIDELFAPTGQIVTHMFGSSDWIGPQAPPKWKQALWTIYNPQSVATIRKLQQQNHADAWLFHTVYPVGSPSLYAEALRQNIPIIQYVHNFRPFCITSYVTPGKDVPPLRDYRHTFWREFKTAAWQQSRVKTAILGFGLLLLHAKWLRAVKAWVTLTNVMRQKFIEAGIPAESIFVLPYPWTPMTTPPIAPEENYYLFLGRLSEEKGIPVLCRAWEILRSKLGKDAPRLIIGGSGPLEDYVVAEARKNPLIEYRGLISGTAKTQTIAGCRAMVAPSVWSEPRAIVTYEAYDHVKPMLASSAGGFPETVIDGTTGLLHDPGNAVQLAQQIIDLNASADRRRAMGQKGREWLLAQPTPTQWMDLFNRIVEFAKHSTKQPR